MHNFAWTPESISFQSSQRACFLLPSNYQLIESWGYTGQDIPIFGNENARKYLWLFRDDPPSNKKETEIIIMAFEFTPMVVPLPPPVEPTPVIP